MPPPAPRTLPHALASAGIALAIAVFPLPSGSAETIERNGFRLEPSAIPVEQIIRGGPPRDGIVALDEPAMLAADEASWPDDEMVIGVALGGEARAYPIAILVWHELVNDVVAGRPILVSYCPLCGTGIVFDRRVGGKTLRFGVSGLLYQSDLLMFDRQSESLWSQITARAETGSRMGAKLTLLRSRMERWGRWKREHPTTRVLSHRTGHRRDYARSPYRDYDGSEQLYFPVARDDRFHPKMPTLGLRLPDGRARAYPASEMRKAGGTVEERFGGVDVRVRYDLEAQTFAVEAPEAVEVVEGYWFAWAAFHPSTEVFVAPDPDGR